MAGAERWSALKARQYQLQYPLGVFASDLPLCILLAELPGTEEEVVSRIKSAVDLLGRLRADNATRSLIPVGSDAMAVLALASIPDIPLPAAPVAPVPEAVVEVQEAAPQTQPCAQCGFGSPDWTPPTAPEPVVPSPVSAESGVPAVGGGCDHVGSDGKCQECTGDRTEDCSGCEKSVVVARARQCKDYDECNHLYCSDCVEACINENGYCEDCSVVDCDGDGCGESVDRGTQKTCSRTFCEQKPDLCDMCAARLLNADGLCSGCSGEEERDCSDCGVTHTESRLTKCKDYEECTNEYCGDCKEHRISEQGYCDDCSVVECDHCCESVDRGTEKRCSGEDCDRDFCAGCSAALLNEKGMCTRCSDEEEQDCSDCGNTFTSSRLTECKNIDDCGNSYCGECKEQNLQRRKCGDCRDGDDD